jgi:biopolymer transport protein ExbB
VRAPHDPPETTGASDSAGTDELDPALEDPALDSPAAPEPEPDAALDPEEPVSAEAPDPTEPDSPAEPDPDGDSAPEEPLCEPEAPASAAPPAEPEPATDSPVAEPASPELDRGAWAGALSVEEPVAPAERACAVPLARWASAGARPWICRSVLPGNAVAAIAVNTPVSAALAASSQRLALRSRRSAASRVREV